MRTNIAPDEHSYEPNPCNRLLEHLTTWTFMAIRDVRVAANHHLVHFSLLTYSVSIVLGFRIRLKMLDVFVLNMSAVRIYRVGSICGHDIKFSAHQALPFSDHVVMIMSILKSSLTYRCGQRPRVYIRSDTWMCGYTKLSWAQTIALWLTVIIEIYYPSMRHQMESWNSAILPVKFCCLRLFENGRPVNTRLYFALVNCVPKTGLTTAMLW